MRSAFTMVEVVFVLVITGLVAVSGSLAIIQIMQNYALQRNYGQLELDSTSAMRQITRYLQDSVWDSIAIRNNNGYTAIAQVNRWGDGAVNATNNLVFLEKNNDVINGRFITYQGSSSNIPYFSGFVDLENSSGTTIQTTFEADALRSVNLANTALFFPFVNRGGNVVDKFYNATETARTAIFSINATPADNQMTLSHAPSKIGDIAVIVNEIPTILSRDADNNLIITRDNVATTIAQKVSNLYIWSEAQAGILRVRLCFENSTMDFMSEFCKEGVIVQ